MKKYIFLFIFILSTSVIFAQIDAKGKEVIENVIEEIASGTDAELDYSVLFDDLYFYLTNPLNVNTATKEELEKLYILNDFQMNSLLTYIQENGQLLSIYELQLVYGFAIEDIQKVRPFVTVKKESDANKFNLKKSLKFGSHEIFAMTQQIMEQQVGYSEIDDSSLLAKPDSRYLGSKQKIYTKYRYSYKNFLSFGITAEKDQGEEFFKGTQKNGFDFYSAHLLISDWGKVKKLCVGDYQASFGQGLTFAPGFGTSKSSYVLDIKKKSTGLKKYSSANENAFMRGAAATLRFNNFDFTPFISHKKVDANVQENDTTDFDDFKITSLDLSGYHRTNGEMLDKDYMKELIFGGNLSYNQKKYKLGLTYANYSWNKEIIGSDNPDSYFDLKENQNSNFGFDYQFAFQKINLFGESAISQNGGLAHIIGAIVPMAPQVSFSALYRNYAKNYQGSYSVAFAEGSGVANEEGLYLGVEIYPIKKWKITAYYDSYTFPWLKSGIDAPSFGRDYLVQLDYSLSRNVSMYLRFKNEKSLRNSSIDSLYNAMTFTNLTRLRYNVSAQISKQLSITSRVEYGYSEKEGNVSDGYLIFQDINYKHPKLPLNLSFRYAIFDTKLSIYAYENDVLYAFSIPAYTSTGTKYYLTLKYEITDRIDMWFRYARISYANRDVVGSSLDEIQGNHKSEIKLQVRIKI